MPTSPEIENALAERLHNLDPAMREAELEKWAADLDRQSESLNERLTAALPPTTEAIVHALNKGQKLKPGAPEAEIAELRSQLAAIAAKQDAIQERLKAVRPSAVLQRHRNLCLDLIKRAHARQLAMLPALLPMARVCWAGSVMSERGLEGVPERLHAALKKLDPCLHEYEEWVDSYSTAWSACGDEARLQQPVYPPAEFRSDQMLCRLPIEAVRTYVESHQ